MKFIFLVAVVLVLHFLGFRSLIIVLALGVVLLPVLMFIKPRKIKPKPEDETQKVKCQEANSAGQNNVIENGSFVEKHKMKNF